MMLKATRAEVGGQRTSNEEREKYAFPRRAWEREIIC